MHVLRQNWHILETLFLPIMAHIDMPILELNLHVQLAETALLFCGADVPLEDNVALGVGMYMKLGIAPL